MKRSIFFALLSITFSQTTLAEKLYLGADLRVLNYESRGFEADLNVFSGTVGYKIFDYLNVEAYTGVGIGDDTTGTGIYSTDLEIDYMSGVAFKGVYPVHNQIDLYGSVGYSKVKMTAKSAQDSNSDSTSDTTFGLGLSYNFLRDMSVSLDYSQYVDKSYLELNGVSLGFKMQF